MCMFNCFCPGIKKPRPRSLSQSRPNGKPRQPSSQSTRATISQTPSPPPRPTTLPYYPRPLIGHQRYKSSALSQAQLDAVSSRAERANTKSSDGFRSGLLGSRHKDLDREEILRFNPGVSGARLYGPPDLEVGYEEREGGGGGGGGGGHVGLGVGDQQLALRRPSHLRQPEPDPSALGGASDFQDRLQVAHFHHQHQHQHHDPPSPWRPLGLGALQRPVNFQQLPASSLQLQDPGGHARHASPFGRPAGRLGPSSGLGQPSLLGRPLEIEGVERDAEGEGEGDEHRGSGLEGRGLRGQGGGGLGQGGGGGLRGRLGGGLAGGTMMELRGDSSGGKKSGGFEFRDGL